MKKFAVMLLALLMCVSLCACGGEPVSQIPTVDDVIEGIKYEFKDPDSVQMSDVHIAEVEGGDNEYYVIGTVRAKNSFGGYANPVMYIIHCDNGSYEIEGEYNDASYMMQNAFNDLGCGASWTIS